MTIDAVVLDIEGVTSSVSSVRDRLFPYARRHVEEWISKPEATSLVHEARAAAGRPDATLAEVGDLMREWIDTDAKVPALKSLQGMIWEAGFAAGELTAHVYEDVPKALLAWQARAIRVYIYSSGSVLAQRLWFSHTAFGDLTPWLSGYFDARNAGPKQESASYAAIAAAIETPGPRILFVSDTAGELEAATGAGWQAVQVLRPDEIVVPAAGHPQVADLLQLACDPTLIVPQVER